MWLRTIGVVAVAATFVVTGAFGGSSGGTITTIAGTGVNGFSGDGGPATSARLYAPRGAAVDGQGNTYIATSQDHRVRRVSSGGTISTFAGTGQAGFSGDGGPATSARLYAPEGVAVDGQGNVYIADRFNFRVRKVSPGGTITTFAGGGKPGVFGDGGPATSATLRNPSAVALDGKGNVYIADRDNMRVRKVSSGGKITTIAGTGVQGFSGDGGPATSAQLRFPDGVAIDEQGNVYIADSQNHRVRKVSPGGTITTFAGTGACGLPRDNGPATSSTVCFPRSVAVDAQGNVYIADTNNSRVRKVTRGGTISTFAGTGTCGPTVGNGGPATQAQLCSPSGVALDGQGNVYIAEEGRGRLRKVGGSATANATYAGFYSPSRNLSCEMADRDARGSYVYCQSVRTPKNVRMSLDGNLKICRGTKCLGNPAENTQTLGYGTKMTIGRFACSSQKTGVKCTVIRSGKGFFLSRTGVRRIGR
jgi:sugar lactone lactonase YvrE